jgi:hypothetical protein
MNKVHAMNSFARNIRWLYESLLAAAFLTVFAIPATLIAGSIPVDGNAELQGSLPFSNGTALNGTLEYAVYAPGKFDAAFGAGTDPSGGNNYVYAYAFSSSTSTDGIKLLTVALEGNESVAFPGYVSSTSGVTPNIPGSSNPCHFVTGGTPPVSTSCAWTYATTKVQASQTSKVLYFTSPYDYEWDNATLQGSINTWTGQVPSPVPEPGTLTSLAMLAGIAAMAFARYRR